MNYDYQAVLAAPFGALGVRMDMEVLTGIDFLPASAVPMASATGGAQSVCANLIAYLANPHHRFTLPMRLAGTPFQQRVWRAIAGIPTGSTLTYSELAEEVGSGPRAVANACGANPMPVIIPCHRVVAKNGLGGFMQGRESDSLSIKQWLLAHERGESRTAR